MATRSWLSLSLFLLGVGGLATAEEVFTIKPVSCEPGWMIVEDVEYREVCRKVCRVVPDVKKVRVPCYDIKCDQICKLKCGKNDPMLVKKCACYEPDEFDSPPGGCNRCRERRQLVKRMVEVDHHHFKCVVEDVVEMVPCKVYRKVPCTVGPMLQPGAH